ncbi:MAG: Flp family type IVb pilin [Holosporaceae bacterium]|jgi:pilus assembly protein Flp/PilA|nr:Flp family type IVb pilin [Holosporaceae bacterium]
MTLKIFAFIRKFIKTPKGATLIEYSIIAALIAIVIIAGLKAVGNVTGNIYTNIGNTMNETT